MADSTRRHPQNAPGPWFVDTTCFDCDAARQCAPALIHERDGQSYFMRQPTTPEEEADAARAMLVCPTGSIGTTGVKPPLGALFPLEIEGGVSFCGYNSRKSFGANSFFAQRPAGNLLIDAPRFVPPLVRAFEARGGLTDILLTHRDDVADAETYARHFSARVWIHEADRGAAPFATHILTGRDPHPIRPDLLAIPVPGHTRGSVMFLLEEEFLFTGDSLYASRSLGDLGAFRRACWYSWEEQARSLAQLTAYRFTWVLAGHGGRRKATPTENIDAVRRLVGRMQAGDPALAEWW